MTRLADGDRDAFDPLFARLWPIMRRFATRLLRDAADAEDAAQQALLQVFANAAVFDPRRDALPWILGIVAWNARTLKRRAQRRMETNDPVHAIVENAPTPEDHAIGCDLVVAASRAMDDLGPLDVATLIAGFEGRDVSCSPATFRKRFERALRRLRAAWRARHGAE